MPRWKDDDDRGEFGAWLSERVGERTFDWLAHQMSQRGHAHGASYYRAMASGAKPPGRVIRRALRQFFGAPVEEPTKRAGMDELVSALVDLTRILRTDSETRTSLTEAIRSDLRSLTSGHSMPEPQVANEKTLRERRRYWIDQAFRETRLNRTQFIRGLLPAGRDATLRSWLSGKLPHGEELVKLAEALNVPVRVLIDPPLTDSERLVQWRREALGEVELSDAVPERVRQTA